MGYTAFRNVLEGEVTDEPTCGKGLAEHSVVPRLMADLTDATAEVLERHTAALDLTIQARAASTKHMSDSCATSATCRLGSERSPGGWRAIAICRWVATR